MSHSKLYRIRVLGDGNNQYSGYKVLEISEVFGTSSSSDTEGAYTDTTR